MDKSGIFMSSGVTTQAFEDAVAKNTVDLYRYAFSLGLSLNNRDSRCKADEEFVKFNPDGSEDLYCMGDDLKTELFIRRLVPIGQGKWTYLQMGEMYEHA